MEKINPNPGLRAGVSFSPTTHRGGTAFSPTHIDNPATMVYPMDNNLAPHGGRTTDPAHIRKHIGMIFFVGWVAFCPTVGYHDDITTKHQVKGAPS